MLPLFVIVASPPRTSIARLRAPVLFRFKNPALVLGLAVVVPLNDEAWFCPMRKVLEVEVVVRLLASTRLADDCVIEPPGWPNPGLGWSAWSATLPVVRIAVPNVVPFIWIDLPAVTLMSPPEGREVLL